MTDDNVEFFRIRGKTLDQKNGGCKLHLHSPFPPLRIRSPDDSSDNFERSTSLHFPPPPSLLISIINSKILFLLSELAFLIY
jgi:hypothetical protein